MNADSRQLRVLLCSLLVMSSACGGSALRLSDVTPETIPSLESAQAQRPGDATAMTRLGVAYFRAERYPDARGLLDSVSARDPQNGIAAIYLGMTAEAEGDFVAARNAYQRYIGVGHSGELKSAAGKRLVLVGRREIEYSARQALANEAQLTAAPPEPGTIAVMPFGYTGTNAEVEPLTRGFAQLVVTDLAKSRQVRVLERERMQAMVSEMQLSQQGRADPASAVRSGHLLRAERVVQGSLTDQAGQLRVDAAVVDVNTAGVAAPVSSSNQMDRLFDIEKAVVYGIFNGLGLQLTDAERAAIEQRATQNIQAFLAWSRGLVAEDNGDYAAARQFYEDAQRLDPGFRAAGQSAADVSSLQAASAQSLQQVDVTVMQQASVETGTVATADQVRDALNSASAGVAPTGPVQQDQQHDQQPTAQPVDRATTPDATRTTGVTPVIGTVIIIIRRP
jgi:TolB-like protein